MEKTRIAMIVNSNIYSGLEKVVSEIMIELRDKYEFIYVTKDGPVVERYEELGLNYYLINKVSVKEIKRFINKWKPDIIHAHDFTASTIVSICGFKNFISHLHNNPLWLNKICINSFAYLYFGFRAKKILIVSDSVKREFIFQKFISKKFENINNPISVKDVRSNLFKGKSIKYDICCVGRVTTQKNPLRFLSILERIREKLPGVKACWVGDGELLDECEKFIKDHGLENTVHFLGYKKNPYEVMNQSKIFMLTSAWEGFGLVAFESLCLGVPCIVSNVGGLSNIVDNSCGYLCKNDLDFINAAQELLLNETLYTRMSVSAEDRAKDLDNKDNYMRRIANIYEELLEEKQ